MDLQGHTILITGGASGIGFGLATRLAAAGSEVIVCGRREAQLEEAKRLCPALHTLQADVSTEAGRMSLAARAIEAFPKLDFLINNAGVQNRPPRLTDAEPQDWASHAQELAINLHAPMHLSMLLVPHLLSRPRATIVNVSSGLAFVPLAFMPTYCATKAALHSYTLSLRKQLAATSVRVVEIIPPMVNTDLGGKGLHDEGAPLDVFSDHCLARLAAGDLELGYGFSEKGRLASRAELDAIFEGMNRLVGLLRPPPP
jgi:uncharacterized oxidoreductase